MGTVVREKRDEGKKGVGGREDGVVALCFVMLGDEKGLLRGVGQESGVLVDGHILKGSGLGLTLGATFSPFALRSVVVNWQWLSRFAETTCRAD